MSRRAVVPYLVALLVGLSAHAQPRAFRIAWMDFRPVAPGDEVPDPRYYIPFRERLHEKGIVLGKHAEIRVFPSSAIERRPPRELIDQAIAWHPDVMLVRGATFSKLVQKSAPAIPLVFSEVQDPVLEGLVDNVSQPGRNATGLSAPLERLAVKRLEFAREMLPSARRIAVLVDRTTGNPAQVLRELALASAPLALRIEEADAGGRGLVPILSTLAATKPDAVLVAGVINDNHYYDRLAAFQTATRIPVLDDITESAKRGIVLALSQDVRDTYRRQADMVLNIIAGAKPANIPVDDSTRIQLVINAAAAKSVGIKIPQSLLFRADQVIQ